MAVASEAGCVGKANEFCLEVWEMPGAQSWVGLVLWEASAAALL